MVKSRKQDAVIGIFMIAVGIFCWINTRKLDPEVNNYTHIVLAITMILGAVLTIWSFVKKDVPAGDDVSISEFKNPMIGFVILVVYVFLMGTIGFFVSSAAFMVAFAYWMGYRRWIPIVGTTIGMLLFVYVLFNVMLKVRLPMGLLF